MPTYSSLQARKQLLQSWQSATSMTMFHFFIWHLRASHFSTSIRHELGAMPQEFGVMNRLLVRMFTQPPRSGDSPGSPSGS